MSRPPRIALVLSLAFAVAVAVGAALLTVGGPGTARLQRLDEQRVQDVQALVEAIERHRVFTGRLPTTLAELRTGRSGDPPPQDPGTLAPYGYEILDADRFRVCTELSGPDAAPPLPEPVRTGDQRRVVATLRDPETGELCRESDASPG